MKKVGIGGAQILDVSIYLPEGPIRYNSDSWHEHIQYAIRAAAELGLEIDVANSAGWSGSGGPWITPDRGMKQLVWSETETDGGSVSIALNQPSTKLDFYRDLAVIAVPPTSERLENILAKIAMASKPVTRSTGSSVPGIPESKVLNITDKMDTAGQLSTTLPAGHWTVLRFGYTCTGAANHPAQPEGHGLEADKLDPETVAFQFDHALGRIIREAGPHAGKTLRGVLFDSFEAGFQNWTVAFPAEFSKRKGYNFLSWLPVITGRIIKSQEASEGVLWDFRNVLDELFAENYFGTMHKLAAAHGLKVYAESQGGPLNPMSANRHVDFPMNEFWMPEVASRASRIKMTTSAAGFLGCNVIPAEAFTATPENGKYQAIPATLKGPGDYAFTTGINRFIFHHYTHQPVTEAAPGFSLGRYGTHFGRLITWWPYADAWIRYLCRSQFLLQQGRTVADVCVLADEDLGYGFPSKMTNFVPGHDFNVCAPSDLRAMSVRDGRLIHPKGQSYSFLVLPENWVAEVSMLQQLQKLLSDGATVVGRPPVVPAGFHDTEARGTFNQLVTALWGSDIGKQANVRKVGLGTLYQNSKPIDVLQKLALPADVSWDSDTEFRFIHRVTPEADIYFVFNYSDRATLSELQFRQQNRTPEIWDASTGIHSDAPIFKSKQAGISVPIQFEPWGSVFVIFRHTQPKQWITAVTPANLELRNGTVLASGSAIALTYSDGACKTLSLPRCPASQDIQGPWQIAFTDGRGAPPTAVFPKLVSWTENSDPGIKYYSGSAIYKTVFQANAPKDGQRAILDLGNVADIARVVVNGQSVGVLWKPPFRTEISRLLLDGANTLEIHIANRWINRIIGDEAIPVDYAYQKPGKAKFTDGRLLNLPSWLYDPAKKADRKRYSFSTWRHFGANSPLVPSGLLGPVKLEWFAQVPLSAE